MVSCNESSQSDAGGVASYPLTRAGLRQPPRGAEPTGVFVVIEMAVLSCVSALAMVSIIVSIDDGVTGQHLPQITSPSTVTGHAAAVPSARTVAPAATGGQTTAAKAAQ